MKRVNSASINFTKSHTKSKNEIKRNNLILIRVNIQIPSLYTTSTNPSLELNGGNGNGKPFTYVLSQSASPFERLKIV
jgi:hypothetical protein